MLLTKGEWGGEEEEAAVCRVSTKPAWAFRALSCAHSTHTSAGENGQVALLVRPRSPQLFGIMQLAA